MRLGRFPCSPGGHFKIPHSWPGQNSPSDCGGHGDSDRMPGQSAAVAAVLFMTCYQLRRVKCGTEIALTGGRTAAGIVRIRDTVRRPISARSDFVHGILRHLEAKGFQGASLPGIGREGQRSVHVCSGSRAQ